MTLSLLFRKRKTIKFSLIEIVDSLLLLKNQIKSFLLI